MLSCCSEEYPLHTRTANTMKKCALKPSGLSNHYVILAKLYSLQMLLLYTAIVSVHTHPPWPTSDLGCSNAQHIQSNLTDVGEATQHCVQANVMLKYHYTSSMAPILKPTSINIFFSKRLICLGLDSLHPHPSCANSQKAIPPRTQFIQHSPVPVSPENPSPLIYGLNFRDLITVIL